MADPLLHIKDSFYFEVPKFAWRRDYDSRAEFPDVWVKLDPDYQHWEAERQYEELERIVADYNRQAADSGDPLIELPPRDELFHQWHEWTHESPQPGKHPHFGKPFDEYLERNLDEIQEGYDAWKRANPDASDKSFNAYLQESSPEDAWFARLMHGATFRDQWEAAKERAEDVAAYKQDPHVEEWSKEKIDAYNHHLSGKVLIPQPFGELRNLHERESGFTISKYLIIEVVAAILIFVLFRWLAVRLKSTDRPKGRLANMLEVFLVFIRDQIARPAIGHHDADRFVPLLWTIFLFVLFCNLFGMIPMFGAPTAVFGVTLSLAIITFAAVVISGMRQFGPVGFFLNQVPHMDLPLVIAIFVKPMVFLIEIIGLLIRHAVLAIRLLANMAAGHLVILGIMAVVFGAAAAVNFAHAPAWQWGLGAVIVVVGSALFSVLELFVAFLQAYIFTFLSALFIGAAVHHH